MSNVPGRGVAVSSEILGKAAWEGSHTITFRQSAEGKDGASHADVCGRVF